VPRLFNLATTFSRKLCLICGGVRTNPSPCYTSASLMYECSMITVYISMKSEGIAVIYGNDQSFSNEISHFQQEYVIMILISIQNIYFASYLSPAQPHVTINNTTVYSDDRIDASDYTVLI
jgi:hypothetical protein